MAQRCLSTAVCPQSPSSDENTEKSSRVCVQHHMFCLGLREDEGHCSDVFVVGTTPGACQHGFSFVYHLA